MPGYNETEVSLLANGLKFSMVVGKQGRPEVCVSVRLSRLSCREGEHVNNQDFALLYYHIVHYLSFAVTLSSNQNKVTPNGKMIVATLTQTMKTTRDIKLRAQHRRGIRFTSDKNTEK